MTSKRVLLILDDKFLTNLYREKLEGSGFVVDHCRSLEQAMRLAEQRGPDLVLLDLVLKAGSGLHFVKQFRSMPQTLEIPVLIFPTTLAQMAAAAIHAGATKIVSRGTHTIGSVIDTAKVVLGMPGLGDAANTSLFQPDDAWCDTVVTMMPEAINQMRHCLPGLVSATPDYATLQVLWAHVHAFSEKAMLVGMNRAAQVAGALDALLCDLAELPEQINPSVLRTIGQAVDFLGTLSSPENRESSASAEGAAILVVEDEESTRQFIGSAMEMAGLKFEGAATPAAALERLSAGKCDLIFLDIGLPEMSGFDLCSKIRSLEAHKKTPVIFLTGMATFQNRAQASLSGGNDFIGKPFNLAELGLKALMWIFRGQLGLL